MKYIIFCLFSFFYAIHTYGQNPSITIIGTIHSGNQKFSEKTLYRLLKELKPDIILQEQSEPFRIKRGMLFAKSLGIIKPSIEQSSIQKYKNKHRKCLILPYDTTFNRKEHIYQKSYYTNKIHKELFEKASQQNLPKEDSIIVMKYLKKYNDYYTSMVTLSLHEINQKDFQNIACDLLKESEAHILPLVQKYVEDVSLKNWYASNIDFWYLRNLYMSNKIIEYAHQYKGKRIVVLTGLNHKCLLLELITSKDNILFTDF